MPDEGDDRRGVGGAGMLMQATRPSSERPPKIVSRGRGGGDHALLLDAYNHARRLKTLRGLTPYEFICRSWAERPQRFTRDPTHLTLGPNS